jgi:protein gp37
MGAKTKIEWTGSTWGPIRARNTKTGKKGWHCVHKSEACRNCYAESLNLVYGTGLPYKPGHLANGDVEMFLDEKILVAPFKWRAPRPVFPCSTTDLFADFVKFEWIVEMFGVMAVCSSTFHGPGDGARQEGHWTTSDGRKVPVRWPNMKRGPHTFQILTKRPDRMREVIGSARFRKDVAGAGYRHAHNRVAAGVLADSIEYGDLWPLPNVWLGTSAGDQPEANANLPHLRATPAAKRFVSFEPLLGPIADQIHGIDWAICGGESGRGARPMHPNWARSLRDQCQAAGVAFFFKQWGEHAPATDPANGSMRRVGKKAAGAMLDGREHREFPT